MTETRRTGRVEVIVKIQDGLLAQSEQGSEQVAASGLHRIYPPEGEDDTTTIDIVAIHGLGTGSPMTWEAYEYDDTGAVKRQVNWLCDHDMLPHAVPAARIYTFDWDSRYYEDAPISQILDVSQVLLERLRIERDENKSHSRPLIFVASCFGGLILAQALDLANKHLGEDLKILTATCGIVFLGSPLQGTRAARTAEWRTMISGILQHHPSDSLLKDLDGSTRKLYPITRRFVQAVKDGQMQTKIVCFFEMQTTQMLNAILPSRLAKWMPFWKTRLVDEDSATWVGYKAIGLDARHAMLNKFRGPADHNYKLVAGVIKEMAGDAHRVISMQRGGSSGKAKYYIVPSETVGSYTARAKLSKQLEEKLHHRHEDRDPPHAIAVYGLGGCGKTQLTLNYIEKHREKYKAIFWIDASSEAAVLSSFKQVAAELCLATSEEKLTVKFWETDTVRTVLRWFRESPIGDWLVVLDNVDETEWLVRNAIPKGSSGTVIITSQLEKAKNLFDRESDALEVYRMEKEEAITLLLKGRKTAQPLSSEEQASAEKIVHILDGLPLAIDLARPVIEQSKYPDQAFRRYLARIEDLEDRSWAKPNMKGLLTRYEKTVETVWDASIEAVERLNPGAAKLLDFFSFFDPSSIQDELFRLASEGFQGVRNHRAFSDEDFELLPEWLRALIRCNSGWCEEQYEDAIGVLQLYSLVRPVHGERPGISMHRLVRWRAKAQIEKHDLKKWHTWVLLFISRACAWLAEKSIEFRRHIVVHLETLIPMLLPLVKDTNRASLHASIVSNTLSDAGRWEDAEKLNVELVQVMKANLGQAHPDTIGCIDNLALTYMSQGRYEEAEKLQVEVLSKGIRELGSEHPETIRSMHNLALIYWSQGRLEEAEKLLVEVIKKKKTRLGVDHPETIKSIDNLASIYLAQGRCKEAEELQVEVLRKRITKLGYKHQETITSMHSLALIYRSQGRLEEAEKLQVEVVQQRKTKLGKDHPETLTSINNLASTYLSQGRWKEAEKLLVEVVQQRKTKLGKDHPSTLTSMNNLAIVLKETERSAEAIKLMDEVVRFGTARLGADHPHTIGSKKAYDVWQSETPDQESKGEASTP